MTRKISKRIIQKIIIGFVALAVIFVFDFWIFSPRQFPSPDTDYEPDTDIQDVSEQASYEAPTSIIEQPIVEEEKEIQEEEASVIEPSAEILKQIKPLVNLSVPFTSQSPFAKWDDLHNEACEEAVLIMAKYWLNNQELTKDKANEEILAAVQWQEESLGGHYDLRVSDIVDLARRYFGIEKIYFTSVRSIEDIKYELSKGNLVITPMAGRVLNNPNYRRPGPAYHGVVVKGYDEENIITNDPGTRLGADFTYSYENFLNAIHDWPFSLEEVKFLSKDEKAEKILQGGKVMIVVEKD